MSRYLVLWEVNPGQMPANPKERATLMSQAGEMVDQNISKGIITSWGAFLTGRKGYSVWECDPSELYKQAQQFYPQFTIQIHQVLSREELLEVTQ